MMKMNKILNIVVIVMIIIIMVIIIAKRMIIIIITIKTTLYILIMNWNAIISRKSAALQ